MNHNFSVMLLQTALFFQYLLVFYFTIQVAYLLFFSIAGRVVPVKKISPAQLLRRIRIFIPGCKEDAVIIATAKDAINQDYPSDLFEVVIIADSFSETTLAALRLLPLKIIEVNFEKSTKGKALQKGIEFTADDPVDIAVILDADNHMAPGFLHAVNDAFGQGFEVVQGHRIAKNVQTSFAFLDACIEEINNHFFRRGHVAVGLPAALIGSAMAFDWNLFVSILQDIGETSGEDREFEFRLLRQRKKIAFLDGVFVYDEKVANSEVFSNQRSRWLAIQLEFLKKYFIEGWVQLFKGNIAFFNKLVQTFIFPRILLISSLFVWLCWVCFFSTQFVWYTILLLGALFVSLLIAIPIRLFNKKLLIALFHLPLALISMLNALLKMPKASKQFIHTPHVESEINLN